jgi:hypothetical protein
MSPFFDDDTEPEPDPSTTDGLSRLIEMQRDRIIAVGTGGPAINTVDADYERRRRVIAARLTPILVPERSTPVTRIRT